MRKWQFIPQVAFWQQMPWRISMTEEGWFQVYKDGEYTGKTFLTLESAQEWCHERTNP